MTDIVKRLRDIAEDWFGVGDGIHEPINQGADEIERLREALRDIACDCEHDCADSPLGLSPVTPNCCRNFARIALGEDK